VTVRLTVGQKIISIASVVLILMITVAAVSVRYMRDLRRDLHTIATLQAPATEAMARVDVRVLEQGLLLERLLEQAEDAYRDITKGLDRFMVLQAETEKEFAGAQRLLEREAASEISLRPALVVLGKNITNIQSQVDEFSAQGLALLNLLATGDIDAFEAGYDKVTGALSDVGDALATLRAQMAERTNAAVARAERDEQTLILLNIALTLLAAVLGLIFALAVTAKLVGSVRNLVDGTRAVEAGHLDVSLEKRSEDEMGELTLSFNTMVGGLRLKERIKDTFGKYMDPRIVANLVDNPEFVEPGGERREMTVMFVDLKGFTTISETLEPDDLVRMINLFFGHVTEAVGAYQGVVDKFMGDAVMTYWGPPFTDAEEQARLACAAALGVSDRLSAIRADIARALGSDTASLDIDLRIGVSTGLVLVGTVGSKASRSYTVMGDPVNLGSRLEGTNKTYGTRILISERTRELAGGGIATREIDMIRVKGKVQPVRVFELSHPADRGNAQEDRFFAKGLAAIARATGPRPKPPSRPYSTHFRGTGLRLYIWSVSLIFENTPHPPAGTASGRLQPNNGKSHARHDCPLPYREGHHRRGPGARREVLGGADPARAGKFPHRRGHHADGADPRLRAAETGRR